MAPAAPNDYNIGKKGLRTGYHKDLVGSAASAASRGNSLIVCRGNSSDNSIDIMDMAASENSSAHKRKFSTLVDVETYDRFAVLPMQVLSLRKMSNLERKDLETRLKSELDQIRILRRRVASFDSKVDNNRSGILERPVIGTMQKQTELSSLMGSKGGASVYNNNNDNNNNGGSAAGRFGSGKKAIPASTSSMLLKQCEGLVNKLLQHRNGWVFAEPVDPVKWNIPDYFDVVKHPMDLGTVKKKLLRGDYQNMLEFAEDMRLTFSNAMTYNPKGNYAHDMAEALSKFFESRWKPIVKKLASFEDSCMPSVSAQYVGSETSSQVVPDIMEKVSMRTNNTMNEELVKHAMNDADKHKLKADLEAALEELPENIIVFLKEQCDNGSQTQEDEIEVDIDDLSDEKMFVLRKLLDDYLVSKQMKQGKAESCEIELHNHSSHSNSSVQPFKGNDAVDEDVDIGGNDPPNSSCPPVLIEKDAVIRNSKLCSSSSSSSSDSSSSDSSSDSDSGDDVASATAQNTNENTNTGPDAVQKSIVENPTVDVASQMEEQDSAAVVKNGSDDGESAPPGRQVSPQKQYRAALLRSRFADTIIKAQEKALEKGEKQDPEKLRLEREGLEKRRREEKARLQAEAIAAEEAQRKAEEAAVAELKRKREAEREAARKALQEMEKMVNIDDNCGFMEDFEMLRGGGGSNALLVENLSMMAAQEISNPLEKLGLYMKTDEEDDDCEPLIQNSNNRTDAADAEIEEEEEVNNEDNHISDTNPPNTEEGEID
ncbi:transcription factor GTE10-like [Impatiens glandulifera]|uniref:transcription factor GTE10-like n=1 Tax=Impatiens glandulifera TaxID=253017 RepID=UPI001FB0BEEE|nr:transcription factor GTE10-like [Impatiens glandulifera]